MPTTRGVDRLDFPEKLLQSGKKETTEALLKRLKVSSGQYVMCRI